MSSEHGTDWNEGNPNLLVISCGLVRELKEMNTLDSLYLCF
jgi:hypothetical protein